MSSGPLVVVGDVLLDQDIDGDASRLAPDAPVPVVDVARERSRPGGARRPRWRWPRSGTSRRWSGA